MFFATAGSREELISAYMAIAGILKLPECDANDQMLAVDAVKRWLGSQEGWLLILDSADPANSTRIHTPGKRSCAIDHTGAGRERHRSARSDSRDGYRGRRAVIVARGYHCKRE